MSEAVRKHKQYLFPAVALYYKEPIAIARGEGHYVWDDTGKKYLDAFGGVLTVSVGHANPHVVDAVVTQVKRSATRPRSTPTKSNPTSPKSSRKYPPATSPKPSSPPAAPRRTKPP